MNNIYIYFICLIIFYYFFGIKTYYGKSKFGRGIISCNIILPGEIIEKSPTIFIDEFDEALSDYVFNNNGKYHVTFGLGSMFNHNDKPNVDWYFSKNREITYIANRMILPSEELFISYGKKYWRKRKK